MRQGTLLRAWATTGVRQVGQALVKALVAGHVYAHASDRASTGASSAIADFLAGSADGFL